jgi:outer membrane receptor protein involved in Fe transport
LAALTATAPLSAHAQAAPPSGPSNAPSSASTVAELVVTAQKRSERYVVTPAAVTALTASDLQRTQATDLVDYAAQTPGLDLITEREGQTQIILRGITTGSSTPNTTVSTYIDDTPFGSSTTFADGNQLTPDLDPSDLQRVEVLRGPQGTLYGASSLGGLIKYVSVLPNANSFGGRLEVDGSTVDHGGTGYGVRGMVNIPVVKDTLALRVSAFDRLDPGYIDDPNLGLKNLNYTRVNGGRASLLWRPIEALSVQLTAMVQNLHGGGTSDEDVNVNGSALTPVVGPLEQTRFTPEPLDIRSRLYSAVEKYDFGWGSLQSVTSYAVMRENTINDLSETFGTVIGPLLGIPDLGIRFHIPIHEDKFTQEFRIQSEGNTKLEWLGGLFFTNERSSHGEVFDPFVISTGERVPVNLLSGSLLDRYIEYAGYGDLTYHFTSKFDVQAGVRYSSDSQHFSQPGTGLLLGAPVAPVTTSSDHSTTFLVTPRYLFDQNNMLYARIASGFRPGGPNALTAAEVAGGVPSSFRPDTLVDYEVGYKASLLDHRLTLDLSAFYIDWKNIQIQTVFNGFDATGNGGTARSDGFEASATFTPITGLNLSGNLTYTDAQLTADAPGVNGKDGDDLPNVPKWAAYVSADYDFPIIDTWNGFVGGSVRYLGDRTSGFVSNSPADFARAVMPAYTTVDLRAGLRHQGWTLEVYVKNVGDVGGINQLSSLAFDGFSNPYRASIIQPRTVGVSLAAGF